MRLIFLGTGSSPGMPRVGHRDPTCRDARAGGKSMRLRSAALVIGKGGTTVLIDAGPDIVKQLNTARPKRLDAVFITHGHADAVAGIQKLDGWIKKHLPKNPPVPLFAAHALPPGQCPKKLILKKLRPFFPIKTKTIVATPLPVHHHPGVKTFGFLFGKNLAYISDTRGFPQKTKELLKNIDTLVLDGAMYFNRSLFTHLTVDSSIKLASELRARRLVITQIGHSYPPHEQAKQEVTRFFKKQRLTWPKKVSLTFDGGGFSIRKLEN